MPPENRKIGFLFSGGIEIEPWLKNIFRGYRKGTIALGCCEAVQWSKNNVVVEKEYTLASII